jgi:NADH-quinone oxidoreductase subunit J
MAVPDEVVFGVLAFMIVGSAIGMVTSRQTVYSALYLVINFISVALVYLTLRASFIGMTQIAVYAGAIMVLFLFVIMLLGPERLPPGRMPVWRRVVGILFGLGFMGELLVVLLWGQGQQAAIERPPDGFAGPEAIGLTLFNEYAVPLEVASVLLLVGIIGAVALAQRARKKEVDLLYVTAAEAEAVSAPEETTATQDAEEAV